MEKRDEGIQDQYDPYAPIHPYAMICGRCQRISPGGDTSERAAIHAELHGWMITFREDGKPISATCPRCYEQSLNVVSWDATRASKDSNR